MIVSSTLRWQLRQYLKTVLRNGNRMLKMSAPCTVPSNYSPDNFKYPNISFTYVNHRLDCKHHSRLQPRSSVFYSIVRNLRFFMKIGTDPMTNIFTNDRKSCCFNYLLYGVRYRIQSDIRLH